MKKERHGRETERSLEVKLTVVGEEGTAGKRGVKGTPQILACTTDGERGQSLRWKTLEGCAYFLHWSTLVCKYGSQILRTILL